MMMKKSQYAANMPANKLLVNGEYMHLCIKCYVSIGRSCYINIFHMLRKNLCTLYKSLSLFFQCLHYFVETHAYANTHRHIFAHTRTHTPQSRQCILTFKRIVFRVGPLLHSEWKALQLGHCTADFHALMPHKACSFHQMIRPS